jgi:hypothetical protein
VPDAASLLAAYDDQLRPAEATNLPPGVHAEVDGPIVRIVGQHRGFISSPSDLRIDGDELDALIARQRAFFGASSEAVEWKARRHDRSAGLIPPVCSGGFRRRRARDCPHRAGREDGRGGVIPFGGRHRPPGDG